LTHQSRQVQGGGTSRVRKKRGGGATIDTLHFGCKCDFNVKKTVEDLFCPKKKVG